MEVVNGCTIEGGKAYVVLMFTRELGNIGLFFVGEGGKKGKPCISRIHTKRRKPEALVMLPVGGVSKQVKK